MALKTMVFGIQKIFFAPDGVFFATRSFFSVADKTVAKSKEGCHISQDSRCRWMSKAFRRTTHHRFIGFKIQDLRFKINALLS